MADASIQVFSQSSFEKFAPGLEVKFMANTLALVAYPNLEQQIEAMERDGYVYFPRDPNEAEDRKTMFGQGQIDWLKASLKASTATFKVIANGNSMVVDFTGRGERWDNFGADGSGELGRKDVWRHGLPRLFIPQLSLLWIRAHLSSWRIWRELDLCPQEEWRQPCSL